MPNLVYAPGTYLAIELDAPSRAALLKTFQPVFSKVLAHHITLEFQLTPQKLAIIQDLVGLAPKIMVRSHVTKDGVECVGVTINGRDERLDGSFYHVTVSVEPPHKPMESNHLRPHLQLIRGFLRLTGELKLLKK